ncbi:MAG: WecB/TagA/CpsF family glycosyltransferase [Prevotellaceae bacterium]|jgi:N-acetylglucosaminyldiphosphoundecaprenol N-acetyl-beta-D-mannosaminyltransferase|nr:WecB/TagA/CpsF family glycosyltransferase [Prevotellaceae bacterium]
MKKISLISLNVSVGAYRTVCEKILQLISKTKSEYICVANVHMLVEAYRNKEFAEAVNNSAITAPDGVPLTWGLKWLYGIKQERVAGMDLLPDLLSLASQHSIAIFFYGATEETLLIIRKYIMACYKGIPFVGSYSPPFRPLTPDEEENAISQINNSGAKIVFVSLGCPKQERWMASMKGRINAVMIGIGGALPVIAGIRKRAPKWMQKAGLEWLFRLLQEPRRLFKRYLITNSIFIYILIKMKINPKSKLRRSAK